MHLLLHVFPSRKFEQRQEHSWHEQHHLWSNIFVRGLLGNRLWILLSSNHKQLWSPFERHYFHIRVKLSRNSQLLQDYRSNQRCIYVFLYEGQQLIHLNENMITKKVVMYSKFSNSWGSNSANHLVSSKNVCWVIEEVLDWYETRFSHPR